MFPLRNQYLKEMGVDVWLLRGSRAIARPAPAAEQKVVPIAKTDAGPVRTGQVEVAPPARRQQPKVATGPVPAFQFCFMDYPGLSLVFEVPIEASSLPEPQRRFATDVVTAWRGASDPKITSFKWPMVKSQHVDQSESAAAAALAQRVRDAGQTMLLFGEIAAKWIEPSAGDRKVLKFPAMQVYFAEPARKRELWRTLTSELESAR
ncbi:MAG: hypothetical protein KDI19_03600 [Pseudomonadales bacterium]|nr:hypothetical protein [Pseudomonadales bacterium]